MTQYKPSSFFLQTGLFCLLFFPSLQGFATGMGELTTAANAERPLAATNTPIKTASHPFNSEYKKPALVIAAATTRPITIKNGKFGPVKLGDNLYQIARAANPNSRTMSLQDTMQAIFKANPHAFLENMEQIKLGATLTIPDFSTQASAAKTSADSTETSPSTEDKVPTFLATPPAKQTDKDAIKPASEQQQAPDDPPIDSVNIEEEKSTNTTPSPALEADATIVDDDDLKEPQTPQKDLPEATPEANMEVRASEGIQLPDDPQASEDTQTSNDGQTSSNTLDALEGKFTQPDTNVSPLQPESEELQGELGEMRNQLDQAHEELDQLIDERESLNVDQAEAASRAPTPLVENPIPQWVPWVLVALMLPALLFLLMRKRKKPAVAVAAAPEPQAPNGDIQAAPPNPTNEFESTTLTGQEGQEAFAKETDTVEVMTSPIFGLHTDQDELRETNDLMPAGEETQQPLRPEFPSKSSTQTLECESERIEEADASVDMAQEADIYLAYEQYSLAERTIDQLLESEPESERNRLLQLKLYAETGRLPEMQNLASKLLEKHPDPESGRHKQIQTICEGAINQHGAQTTLQIPDPGATSSTTNIGNPDRTDDEPITKDPASESLYSDDISDYLSEDTLTELDGLGADTMNIEYEDFAHALLDDNAPLEDLTEDEMDAISAEMELLDTPDRVVIDSTTRYSDVERFSDTDPHYLAGDEVTVELSADDQTLDVPSSEPDAEVNAYLDTEASLDTQPNEAISEDGTETFSTEKGFSDTSDRVAIDTITPNSDDDPHYQETDDVDVTVELSTDELSSSELDMDANMEQETNEVAELNKVATEDDQPEDNKHG
jgi:FimV-like protein